MATLFISDLHLEDQRPEITSWLVGFLRGPARQADALYILGDLFEYWIGDDVVSETAKTVAGELHLLADQGVPIGFLHGNRDFLIGSDYAAAAGLRLLPESLTVDLYGRPTVLLHGDTLCTDDVGYQAFRQQVRNPAFQQKFLTQSVAVRLAMAASARDASKQHTGSTAMAIMDVNPEAVNKAFNGTRTRHMIHGHTHRPAVHQHVLENGLTAERIVLADWHQSGSYLRVNRDGAVSLPLPA
jgi:UDP-2,3-diacylglucosamine hydrolase